MSDILLEKGIDLVEQCNLVSNIFSPDEIGKLSPIIKRLIVFGYMDFLETRRPSLLAEIPKRVGKSPDAASVINSLEIDHLEKLLTEHPTRISFEYNDNVFYLVDFIRWREIYPSKEGSLHELLLEYYSIINTLISFAKDNKLFSIYLLEDGLLGTEKLPPYPILHGSNGSNGSYGSCEGENIIRVCTGLNYIHSHPYAPKCSPREGTLVFTGNPPQPFY